MCGARGALHPHGLQSHSIIQSNILSPPVTRSWEPALPTGLPNTAEDNPETGTDCRAANSRNRTFISGVVFWVIHP